MGGQWRGLAWGVWISLGLGGVPGLALAQGLPPSSPPAVDLRRYPLLQTYDLGTLALAQAGVDPEWATMPVPLTGVIGLPAGDHPIPWVVILHGRHGGCHFVVNGPSRWPCADEMRYDRGLAYLGQGLVEAGFGVMLPNLNGAFSATYGATPERRNALADQRSQAIIDAHLTRLAAAHRGEDPGFGANLTHPITNRVDWEHLGMLGHSMGGGAAALSALTRQGRTHPTQIAQGLGPVAALLLVAPTRSQPMAQWPEVYPLPDVPTAVILGGCDRDITDFSSLYYAEMAAQMLGRINPVAVILPLGANHTFFNAAVREDDYYRRPDHAALCNPQQSRQRLSRVAQETWLTHYSQAFFAAIFNPEASSATNLALAAHQPAPAQIDHVPVITHLVWPGAQRRVLFAAPTDWSRETYLAYRSSPGLTLTRCPAFAPCGQRPRPHPPFPSLLQLSWVTPTESFHIPMPTEDFRGFRTLQLRLAADPGTPRPSLAVVLRDRAGRAARVDIPPTTPALRPLGDPRQSPTPPIYPTAIRIPLAQFQGVDLAALASLDLVLDTTPQGTLYLASLELLRMSSLDRVSN